MTNDNGKDIIDYVALFIANVISEFWLSAAPVCRRVTFLFYKGIIPRIIFPRSLE